MNTCAIVAEYNPFHNGHKLHIEKTREITGCGNIIAIMSGCFVQRGEPALCDKYARTEMALKNGADLVLELPLAFATASAEYFAMGAVAIAERSNIIDCLSFGSECGKLQPLQKASEVFADENESYTEELRKFLDTGLSFPSARAAVSKNIINMPNDILAVEYLKALSRMNSKIIPFTINREGGGYNNEYLTGSLSSATAIRKNISSAGIASISDAIPENCGDILSNTPLLTDYRPYFSILKYIIASKTAEELSEIQDVSEGLENRIISAVAKAHSLESLVMLIKTKRYTYTRIKRVLIHILLDIKKSGFVSRVKTGPEYIRVLGFRKEKSELLRALTQKSDLPVVINLKSAGDFASLSREIEATDIFNSLFPGNTRAKNWEFSMPVIIP